MGSYYLGMYVGFLDCAASKGYRAGGWDEIVNLGGRPPQCSEDMSAELLPCGAGFSDAVACGFEYCLDAPSLIPNGSVVAVGVAYSGD